MFMSPIPVNPKDVSKMAKSGINSSFNAFSVTDNILAGAILHFSIAFHLSSI